MPETNAEFARAVTEVLDWMATTPETAAAALGINHRTLQAMCQGIVPMRSLVIRFATGVAQRCQQSPQSPKADQAQESHAWWQEVDAWLKVAGYPPRRDTSYDPADRPTSRPPQPTHPNIGSSSGHPPGSNSGSRPYGGGPGGPTPPARPQGSAQQGAFRGAPPPSPVDDSPATEHYHPTYERQPWGDTFVHVFWILDRENRRVFQINLPANVDYKARAHQVKQDLSAMSKFQFDRKYGRFRVQGR